MKTIGLYERRRFRVIAAESPTSRECYGHPFCAPAWRATGLWTSSTSCARWARPSSRWPSSTPRRTRSGGCTRRTATSVTKSSNSCGPSLEHLGYWAKPPATKRNREVLHRGRRFIHPIGWPGGSGGWPGWVATQMIRPANPGGRSSQPSRNRRCASLVCSEVIQQLSPYLDGELDSTLARELSHHLEGCRHCRVVVDTTRRTIEIFCNCRPAPLPSGVRRRLRQALARQYGS